MERVPDIDYLLVLDAVATDLVLPTAHEDLCAPLLLVPFHLIPFLCSFSLSDPNSAP